MMFKRIDHVEIVTDQLDRTVSCYGKNANACRWHRLRW
jgi:hypothetical protein